MVKRCSMEIQEIIIGCLFLAIPIGVLIWVLIDIRKQKRLEKKNDNILGRKRRN
jgi:hypothetical protein